MSPNGPRRTRGGVALIFTAAGTETGTPDRARDRGGGGHRQVGGAPDEAADRAGGEGGGGTGRGRIARQRRCPLSPVSRRGDSGTAASSGTADVPAQRASVGLLRLLMTRS